MEYKRDSYGKFGKWHREEALENISALAKKMVDFYKREYKGLNKEKKRIFDVWVLKDRKILDYGYKAEEVKENQFDSEKKVRKQTRKLWIKIYPELLSKEYFKLSVSNFYSELRDVLEKEKKRVTEFHWHFMFWLLKQNKQKTEINIDKLVKILKLSSESKHLCCSRKIVRELYSVFKKINYLLNYEIDASAKNGGTKDILVINPEKFLSLKKRLEKQKEKSLGYSRN
jgi:hypothetical protein